MASTRPTNSVAFVIGRSSAATVPTGIAVGCCAHPWVDPKIRHNTAAVEMKRRRILFSCGISGRRTTSGARDAGPAGVSLVSAMTHAAICPMSTCPPQADRCGSPDALPGCPNGSEMVEDVDGHSYLGILTAIGLRPQPTA